LFAKFLQRPNCLMSKNLRMSLARKFHSAVPVRQSETGEQGIGKLPRLSFKDKGIKILHGKTWPRALEKLAHY